MDRVVLVALHRAKLIDRLAEDIHHAPERRTADGHSDAIAGIVRLHAANHAFGRLHRDSADAAFAEVLLHFDDHVERLRHVEAFARDANGVEDCRQVSAFKFDEASALQQQIAALDTERQSLARSLPPQLRAEEPPTGSVPAVGRPRYGRRSRPRR